MILQPVKSFGAHWILFGIGRIQGLSTSVISYFAILPTSSLMLSSPVSCPLHYFHSLFSSLWVILFSQPRLSTVYCFVLIISAGILISLCFTEACYSTAPSTSFLSLHSFISSPSLPFFFENSSLLPLLAFIICFLYLIFIASSHLFSLFAASFHWGSCFLNQIQYTCTNSNPK